MKTHLPRSIKQTKPRLKRLHASITIQKFLHSANPKTIKTPLFTIDQANAKDFIELANFSLNLSHAIFILRRFPISFRALELLYLFKKMNITIHNQSILFNRIRKLHPQYCKTYQDNKMPFPIHKTFHELINHKLIIKADKTKFSPFILNPKIFKETEVEMQFQSIHDLLYNEKLDIPPLLKGIAKKIDEINEKIRN